MTEKRKQCPICNSSQIVYGPQGLVCRKCGFRNDLNYLEKKNKQEKEDRKIFKGNYTGIIGGFK